MLQGLLRPDAGSDQSAGITPSQNDAIYVTSCLSHAGRNQEPLFWIELPDGVRFEGPTASKAGNNFAKVYKPARSGSKVAWASVFCLSSSQEVLASHFRRYKPCATPEAKEQHLLQLQQQSNSTSFCTIVSSLVTGSACCSWLLSMGEEPTSGLCERTVRPYAIPAASTSSMYTSMILLSPIHDVLR